MPVKPLLNQKWADVSATPSAACAGAQLPARLRKRRVFLVVWLRLVGRLRCRESCVRCAHARCTCEARHLIVDARPLSRRPVCYE